ncbi:MAG: PEP-CTERM sorting domain-containing protein [Planctomycetes bacterium]|nr:PEP-CTERM sorting domain-containing protein [Planctomycetota bacterium]
MNRIASVALAALVLGGLGAGPSIAGTIAGPTTFNHVGGSDQWWGIQFKALQDSDLVAFTFNHRGGIGGAKFNGTIKVVDVTNNSTVFTTTYGNNPNPQILFNNLSVQLNAGDQYQLLATSNRVSNTNDEVYATVGTVGSPISYTDPARIGSVKNGEIQVTNGVFSNFPNSNFYKNTYWGAFTNLVTQVRQQTFDPNTAVPEPASLITMAVGFVGLGLARWKRSRTVVRK